VEFSRFVPDAGSREFELAEEFGRWLLDMVARYPELRVYHYSDYETVHLHRLAERSGSEVLTEVCGLVRAHFVDLFSYIRDNFVGVDGLGLKVVASRGAGFSWRDEEPGGLASQTWFSEAVGGATTEARAAARTRVVQYNEDDVRATLAVRRWLTGLDALED
jgi:predicted RecB family nuclease